MNATANELLATVLLAPQGTQDAELAGALAQCRDEADGARAAGDEERAAYWERVEAAVEGLDAALRS